MKTCSIKKYMYLGSALVSAIILIGCLTFGIYTIHQYKGSYQKEHELQTKSNIQRLNKDIASMQSYLNNVFTDNEMYQTLRRPGITQAQWMSAAYHLNKVLRAGADILDYFGGMFFYDTSLVMRRSEFSQMPTDIFEYRLNEALKDEVHVKTANASYVHEIFQYKERTFLLYLFKNRNICLGYMISLSDYFSLPNNMQLLIFQEDGSQILSKGNLLIEGDVSLSSVNRSAPMPYLIAGGEVDACHLYAAFVREEEELSIGKKKEFLILFLLVPVLCFAGLFQIYKLFVKTIYQPIDYVVGRLEQMKDQEIKTETAAKSVKLKEVELINRKLDELFLEIEQLQREKYRKEGEANAARLQYYQLQIRPHFYLNCLTILDSLLNENNTDTVRQMIYLMSDHIRYTFRDSSSMVTLEEETEEIRAYTEIYMIRNSMPILLQMYIGEREKSIRVPILSIQTFVENAIKYALRSDRVLSIEVKVMHVEVDGTNYLKISIADNGPGFPEEKLQVLNQKVTEFQYNSTQVGVDNIKYRMYLIYGGEAQLYFYNKPLGGAVTEMLLPERKYEFTDC